MIQAIKVLITRHPYLTTYAIGAFLISLSIGISDYRLFMFLVGLFLVIGAVAAKCDQPRNSRW